MRELKAAIGSLSVGAERLNAGEEVSRIGIYDKPRSTSR